MVWVFQRSLSEQLPNPNDETEFQSDLYKNIDPETAKSIIAETHCPNSTMHNISTLLNRIPVYFLISNDIDKDIIMLDYICGECEHLFSSPNRIFYTRHNAHFLTVLQLLLPFGIYYAFQGYCNNVAMILLVAVISILLFGAE